MNEADGVSGPDGVIEAGRAGGVDGADPPGLRMGPLATFLAEHVSGFRADLPLRARLLAAGRSNVTYVVDQDDARCVVRRPPLGHVMESAHDVGREHRVTSGLWQVGYPVPRPLAFCAEEEVLGAPFMVSAYVHGLSLGAADSEPVSAADAGRACQSFVRGLADLHQVDVVAAGLETLGKSDGYVSRQVRRWGRQWETTQTRRLPDMDALGQWLAAHVQAAPPVARPTVVHGDYRLDNLLLNPHDLSLAAVVDWELSTLGDPVSDLAVALVYWTQADDGLRSEVPVASGATSGAGFWTRADVVEAYLRLNPVDTSHLDFCLALACYKLAVIMESIVARTQQGLQLGQAERDREAMVASAPALARLGLAVAAGAGLPALST